MLANPVARVYAEAIFAIARERSSVDQTGIEFEDFLAILEESPDIERFLTTPVLEPALKVQHLRRALEGRVSDVVRDFLCLLVERRRTMALRSIVEAFRAMADEYAGRERVSVHTATPLPDSLRLEIESLLRDGLKKQIALEPEIEPAIMGGAVITIGDKVYDGSIRTRLAQFRKQIMRSGGYEAQG
jgi:F-type H+-transporting ATPase subunit delta